MSKQQRTAAEERAWDERVQHRFESDRAKMIDAQRRGAAGRRTVGDIGTGRIYAPPGTRPEEMPALWRAWIDYVEGTPRERQAATDELNRRGCQYEPRRPLL